MYKLFFLLFSLAALIGCGNDKQTNIKTQISHSKTHLTVYKRESCGCCNDWITHLDKNNFHTQAVNDENLTQFKLDKGIAPRFHSCHTAVSTNGFVFEGHIPAKHIQTFLANKPVDVIGLAVPAMPAGSPGMEMGDRFTPYEVLLLNKDGSFTTYAEVLTQMEQY